jgi:4-hydroxybenzoyl-CoA thioesterase
MSYTSQVKVRFGDIDHAGIAYYPNLYHYCHVAFEDFFEDRIGVPYPRLIEDEKIGFPTVRVESYFRRPIKYGDVLEIEVSVTRVGESSATFEFRANRMSDHLLCFASVHIVVAVDMQSFRPVRIPDRYRELFRRAGAEDPDGASGESRAGS